ncbi:hypothetical protein T484DRAFT_1915342 [Baffinella frigidus]|nr:hypothetical protein T484DRAFT_1915342 [Cryptophyta sp. CCMP2293]
MPDRSCGSGQRQGGLSHLGAEAAERLVGGRGGGDTEPFIQSVPEDLLFILRTQNLVRAVHALCTDLAFPNRARFRLYATLASQGRAHHASPPEREEGGAWPGAGPGARGGAWPGARLWMALRRAVRVWRMEFSLLVIETMMLLSALMKRLSSWTSWGTPVEGVPGESSFTTGI